METSKVETLIVDCNDNEFAGCTEYILYTAAITSAIWICILLIFSTMLCFKLSILSDATTQAQKMAMQMSQSLSTLSMSPITAQNVNRLVPAASLTPQTTANPYHYVTAKPIPMANDPTQ